MLILVRVNENSKWFEKLVWLEEHYMTVIWIIKCILVLENSMLYRILLFAQMHQILGLSKLEKCLNGGVIIISISVEFASLKDLQY